MKAPEVGRRLSKVEMDEMDNVEEAGEDENYGEELTFQSTNAKKRSPYGPQFPELDRIFRAK